MKLETRGSEPRELGVIIPLVQNRIITPIIAETVGCSPRFIGSLVSSCITTIIADAEAVKVLLVTASVCKIIKLFYIP